ncbi:MAG TPA: hypothetical protein VK509_05685, partial [Polyangiales bacterium]|nr:hypothetical protein [Polyangiales bacterium]
SICAEDFAPALDAIAERITAAFTNVCLVDPLLRDAQGLVACELTWTLPAPSSRLPESPTGCDDERFPFLLPAAANSAAPESGQGAGERCRVAQLAVELRDGELAAVPTSHDGQHYEQGWFYDDFSSEVRHSCTRRQRRIALSAGVAAPRDVETQIVCGQRAFDLSAFPPCDGASAGASR